VEGECPRFCNIVIINVTAHGTAEDSIGPFKAPAIYRLSRLSG
jgi:hypothetical protein